MAVQETRQKPLALTQSIDFFRAGSKNYINKSITARSIVLARIDLFAFNSLAAWESKRIRFNGDISHVRFISTTEHRINTSNLERDHARAMNELARIGDVRSVFVFCFCFPMFLYQVKT